jgi:hypothetical protein
VDKSVLSIIGADLRDGFELVATDLLDVVVDDDKTGELAKAASDCVDWANDTTGPAIERRIKLEQREVRCNIIVVTVSGVWSGL